VAVLEIERMPATHFRCPDGGTIEIDKCLEENGCRLKFRCATRSYLMMVSRQRPITWKCPACGFTIQTQTIEGEQDA